MAIGPNDPEWIKAFHNIDPETWARIFADEHDHAADAQKVYFKPETSHSHSSHTSLSEPRYNAQWALSEKRLGDPKGLYYQLMCRLVQRTRMTHNQIEDLIVRLAHS